jgi:cytosine/adenosine deaminase-related metal-dependent hydrolase
MKILLRGGTVLALAAKAPNHREADVLVDAGRIVEVGPGLSAREAEVIDATNTIVMPGFVDAHRLVRMALLRNLGTYDVAVDSVRMTPDDLYAATLVGLLGAIEAGTTTVVDWADFPADPALTEAARQAHADSGLRTVFVHRGDAGFVSTGSTTIAHASSDLTQANVDAVATEWAIARRAGLRIHARAGLHPADAGVVAALGEQGVLGGDVTLVHCSHLSDQDLDAVASSGAAIVVAPSTEMAELGKRVTRKPVSVVCWSKGETVATWRGLVNLVARLNERDIMMALACVGEPTRRQVT